MNSWLEGFACLVIPCLFRDVAVLHEDFFSIPVFQFARKPVPAFENQNAFARGREVASQCATACTTANDDHIIYLGHPQPPSVDNLSPCLIRMWAIRPLQPVWWLAPQARPVSPW